MSEDRGVFGDTWAFTKSAGSGAWNAGAGMVDGVKGLAKGGYKLATDADAREKAWETTQQLVESAKDYGEAVYDDPGKAYRDARDGTLAAVDKFEKARDLAEAEGRLAEFYGEMTGAGVFEIATAVVPVGVVAKAGRLGKVANVAKGARRLDSAEDALGASQKAKRVLDRPVIVEKDAKSSSVLKCPLEDCDKAIGLKNAGKDVPFTTHGLDVDPISIPEGRELMEELARVNPDLSNNKIRELAKGQLASGKEIPIVRLAKPDEALYKIVPKGDEVKDYTPYFISKKQLDSLKENPSGISDTMGLPKSSEAAKYDVYQIKPKDGNTPKVFDSKVASTTEGQITKKGGGEQTIVPNRSDWTAPEKVGEI